jgi:hypothetical protein
MNSVRYRACAELKKAGLIRFNAKTRVWEAL